MNVLPISEADLQAYIDGRLPEARRLQVERWLADNPAAASRLRAYGELGAALRERFEPVLAEPLPEGLRQRAERAPLPAAAWLRWWRPWARPSPAMAIGIAVLGGALGWFGHALWPAGGALPAPPLARQAAVAHAVYSPDQGRPVELGADQQEQLLRWLSKRLGVAVRVPHLGALGYELVGGRLLPGSLGPVAQFMYQDGGGRRLTLYVSPETTENGGAGFRFARQGEVNVFYWYDGPFAYALSAGVERHELAALASAVHAQLEKK